MEQSSSRKERNRMPEQGEVKVEVEAKVEVRKPSKRIVIEFFEGKKPEVMFDRMGTEFNGKDMLQARTFLSRGYRIHKGERARESAPTPRQKSVEKLKQLVDDGKLEKIEEAKNGA